MSRTTAFVSILLAVAVSIGIAQQPAGPAGGAQRPGGRGGIIPPRDPGQPSATAPRGTAVLRGVVLAADTGTPIRRAQVRAIATGARENRLITTDAQGRFEFTDLAAGRYTLSANKGGFVGLQYGQRRPSESGTPLEIADRQVMDKLVIALPRGSVISGRVFDEFGEPVANAVVNALRNAYSGGARRFVNAAEQNSRDTTDDQGAFRLFGLPPGEYIVSANFRAPGGAVTDSAPEPSGYAPTYFPGSPSAAEAQRIRIDVSQEQSGINFALVATRLVRISGSVINAQGAPVANGAIMLMPPDRGVGPVVGPNSARVDRSGMFRFTNVAPGRYVLQTRTMPGPAARGGRGGAPMQVEQAMPEFGRLDLAVGPQDLEGVVIVTAPGARATGQVVSDTQQPLPLRPDQVQIAARSAQPTQAAFPGAGGNARIAQDWTFQISGLFDPAIFRVNNSAQGWSLKQVLLNGQDITDTPLEFVPGQMISGVQIVLTEKSTSVQGAITDSRGTPITDATVVIFPADEKLWMYQSRFIKTARPNQDGRYEIRGLPAYDDYLIAAVQGLEDGQAGDPEFLSAVKAAASRLSLNEGETKAADVKMGAAQ